jgi:glycosyltransferase involved in cell wall biosynthesis
MAELFFFLNMGGVERCIVNLLNYLSLDEFDKHVIVSHYGGMMEKQLSPDTAFIRLPTENRMLHLIQHLKTMDLVHLNTTNMNPFFTWSAAMADVPVIVDTVRSSVENPYASYVDFTGCISEHVASLQARPERTRVIHNGFMLSRSFIKMKKEGNEPVVILEIRRPDKEVQATLVDLVPMLSDRRRNTECWIMGVDGESSGGLKFLGEVPDPAPFLAKADFLFHFPSHEALGNVLIEAMAHGVIPITCNV